MTPTSTNSAASNQRLIAKVKASALYKTYAQAFRTVTGLPLGLRSAKGEDRNSYDAAQPQNRFCELLNRKSSCQGCDKAHVSLLRASRDHVGSTLCFAGLRESAVPVKLGNETVAFLCTGQVLASPARMEDFEALTQTLIDQGFEEHELEALQAAYGDSKVIPKKNYTEIENLLAVFSLQLSVLINQLMLEKESDEPEMITQAKAYIRENLVDSLTLDDVADSVGVSSFYFCKVFKQATQMTFTEYVNRRRIECAKKALLQPYARVTDVAFEVGYQSLSQFNRSFLKYVGESPSKFRKRMSQTGSRKDIALLAS